MKKSITLLLALFFVSQIVSAQSKTEEQTYFDETVFPVLTTTYAEFNEQLSEDDKTLISKLRTEFQVYTSTQKAIREKRFVTTSYSTGKQMNRAAIYEEMAKNEDVRKAIEKELEPFVNNNKTLIDPTIANLETQYQTWHVGLKHKGFNSEKLPAAKRKANTDQMTKLFLLWDGTKDNAPLQPREKLTNPPSIKPAVLPKLRRMSVSFELPDNAETVVVTLHDAAGEIVKIMHYANLSAGGHKKSFEITGVPKGKYTYKVKAGSFEKVYDRVIR